MIEAYVGLPGMGKTLGATHRVCWLLANGEDVISNISITDKVYGSNRKTRKFTGLQDFVSLKNCTFFLDEANIILDSRQFAKTPPEVLHKLAQSRKYGLNMIYTTQGFGHAEARLRDLTNYVWDSKNFRLFGTNAFRYDLYDPENFTSQFKKRLGYYIITPAGIYKPSFNFTRIKKLVKNLYSSYDSYELIENVDLQEGRVNDRHNKISNTNFNIPR